MRYESEYYGVQSLPLEGYLQHHGIKGQKWYHRRFQNEDGSLTAAGRERYLTGMAKKYNLADVPKNDDAAIDNARQIISNGGSDRAANKYLRKYGISNKEYKFKNGEVVDRLGTNEHLNRRNAVLIKRGNFDFENDKHGQELKDTMDSARKEFKKYMEVEDGFNENEALFKKYATKLAESTWSDAVKKYKWEDTPKNKRDWRHGHVYDDFDQNGESFNLYLKDRGYDPKEFRKKQYEAQDKYMKSVDAYVDNALGKYGNIKITDPSPVPEWEKHNRFYKPKKTTLRELSIRRIRKLTSHD